MALPEDQDLPLEDDVGTIGDDVPLDDTELLQFRPQRPAEVDNVFKGQAAMLSSELNDTDVFEAFTSLDTSVDPKILVRQLSYQRAEQAKQYLSQYFNDTLVGSTPEEAVTNAGIYQELLAEEEASKNNPEHQITESITGLGVPEEEREQIKAELMLYNTITDLINDYSGWEKAADFGKALLPTGIFDNKELTDSMFGAEGFMRDVVIGFKDMQRNDPQKFQETFPIFLSSLQEDLPKGKQLEVLTAIAGPRGETELGSFSAFGALFDSADIATLGAYSLLKVVKLTRRLNAIKTAQRLRNIDVAADVNAAALLDEAGEVASSAGVDRVTAASNSAPFNVNELDDAYAAGLSTETISRIKKVKAEQRKVAEIIRTEQGLLREEILTSAERLVAEEKFHDQMKLLGLDDIQVVGRNADSTTFQYKLIEEGSGKTITDTLRMDLKFDDITQSWVNTEEGMGLAALKSPTVFMRNAIEDVRAAIRLDSTSATVGELFRQLQKEALAPILGKGGVLKSARRQTRKELEELDHVLLAGDQYKDAAGIQGKVYTIDELKGGVAGVKLNDRQVEAYYNLRGLYDELFHIRNFETRRTLVAQGKKEIRVGGEPQIGRVLAPEAAIGSLNLNGRVTVYNSAIDEVVELGSKDITALYEQGFRLNRLDDVYRVEATDELYDLVITKIDDVGELPQRVLHYREGYVPKVNKNAYWFVKEIDDVVVNGAVRTGQTIRTVRQFNTKAEADAWLATQNNSKWQVLPDRGLEKQVFGKSSGSTGSGGGLYTGPRASEDIPFGPDGVPAERLNTYEALGQNLQALENYVTRNQWRLAMQQRWINSARAAGFGKQVDELGFAKEAIPEGDPRGVGLRAMFDQIEVWSGFPTKGEQLWDSKLARGQEWVMNSRLSERSKRIAIATTNYLRQPGNDPVSLIRSSAFHSLLGVFNPAQAWVQAQGFSIAAAMHPEGFTGAIRAVGKQSYIGMIGRNYDNVEYIRELARITGQDPKELAGLAKAFHRSGFEPSAINTADHIMAKGGKGVTRESLRRALDKGLFFYRHGEMFNRRYSFTVAAERMKKRTGTYNFTDAELRDVISEANNFMLNLSRSNRAAWQRGVTAIPTQFMQVQTKLIESLWGFRKQGVKGELPHSMRLLDRRSANLAFDVRDRVKILAYQFGLYGAAGIPLGSFALHYAQDVLGFTQEELDENPEIVNSLNAGFWGFISQQVLGADIELSNRGAISAGITESTMDLMFSESTIAEKALGAFGTIPQRGMKAWNSIRPLYVGVLDEDAEIGQAEVLEALNGIASISSTWNNYQKAAFMRNADVLLNSRGKVAVSKDFDFMTEAGVLLGFQPLELQRIRDRDMLVRSRKEYRQQITNSLVQNMHIYTKFYNGAETDEERDKVVRKYEATTKFLMRTLGEADQMKVREALNSRLSNPETEEERSIKQFIEEFSDGQTTAWGSMFSAAQTKGLITNNVEDELEALKTEGL